MVMSKSHVVSVPKTVKSKKVTTNPIHYTVHPKYMKVSCNTDLVNVGKDVTLMMLDTSINDKGNITDEKLFVSTLDTMVKRGKRPPSSTKSGKEDYTPEMTELDTQINTLIKGKEFVDTKGHIIKPMFYMRDVTQLEINKEKKKKDTK